MRKTHQLFFVLSLLLLVSSVAFAQEPQVITLEQAHELALKHNPSLKTVAENVRQAELLRAQAVTVLMPRLSAGANVTRNFDDIAFDPAEMGMPVPPGSDSRVVIQEVWAQHFGFTASIILFDPQTIPLILAASDGIDSAEYNAIYQRNELLFAVTNSYYSLRSAEENVVIAEENLKNAKETVRMAMARFELGEITKVEVMQAELAEQDAVIELENARDTVRIAQTGLAYLIGDIGVYTVVPPVSPTARGDSFTDLQEQAMSDRYDLKALNARKEVRKKQKVQTWAKFFPVFDATYNWGWDSAPGFAGQNESWRFIIGARWNLFDGGQKVVEIKQRESDVAMTEYQIEQLRLSIREDIDKALVTVNRGRRNVELAQKRVELAEETHRLAQKQYEHGMSNSLDLLLATSTLNNARRSLVVAKLSLDLAVLQLNKVAGEVFPLARGLN